ncbi:hypothetical protein LWI28_013335 [Acer negundo]|uniref:Uncharacterized protein n=1 Tax=Acer negundo TaxID=4023 RepID=A0AAD5JKF6_ACENE|nr:hypothetical protein LWI28_013335 [Acer negundo]KAK4856584.1 hypothetical protein QYF36_018979 [Acer negundo]
MASVNLITSLAAILLFIHPMTATSNFLSPLLSPVIDDVCKKVECGKGKCKVSMNSSFLYECECDPGWNQTLSKHDDGGFVKLLPCIVPNCTLDTTCTAAPPPVQDKAVKPNVSIFDPCYWTDCGGGSCNKTSPFAYSCECAEGYFNLFNVSAFSCFKECSIGMDCKNLGISTSNRTTIPAPALSDSGKNQAGLNYLGNCHWLIVLVMSLAILW